VECIVPGKPQDQYPWYYIDPDTCIDCGACVPECPFEAIFPEDEVPAAYKAKGGERVSMAIGTPNHGEVFDGSDHEGDPVHIEGTRILAAGEIVDLTKDIEPNYKYFTDGPGYSANG